MYRLSNGEDFLIVIKPLPVLETVVISPEYRLVLVSTEAIRRRDEDEYQLHDIGVYVFQK
jgi:hypothetical protein